jgi:predicted HicB family RNase H-like nuclease
MPKGEAKAHIVPVRFTAEDLKAMAAAARAKDQSVSEWIRGAIYAAIQ